MGSRTSSRTGSGRRRHRLPLSTAKRGMPPGSLVFTGERKLEQTQLTVFDYDGQTLQEIPSESLSGCLARRESKTVTWVNIDGLHDTRLSSRSARTTASIRSCSRTSRTSGSGRSWMNTTTTSTSSSTSSSGKRDERDDQRRAGQPVPRPELPAELPGAPGATTSTRCASGCARRRAGAPARAPTISRTRCSTRGRQLLPDPRRLGTASRPWKRSSSTRLEKPTARRLRRMHQIKRELILVRRAVWPLREVLAAADCAPNPRSCTDETRVYLRDCTTTRCR